jgi:aspartate aminotransferase-like enzyme/predicted N-acetyltransferase YhbS
LDDVRRLVFKIATDEREFEAIHRLNHRTFAQEIPQHAPREDGRLVDRFHDENTYAICVDEGEVVGMVAGRAKRPFSLEGKLPDLDALLPAGHRPVEIRLLAVDEKHRKGIVFARLVGLLAAQFRKLGCDLALISGTTRQERLYRRMGFVPFGPLVGKEGAQFQPMYLTLERFLDVETKSLAPPVCASARRANFLPGPVAVHPDVQEAFRREPVSHRGAAFAADMRAAKRMLSEMTGAPRVEVLLGSGSLANDAIAAQLSLVPEKGLVLVNGEFGERLVDHATRARLSFDVLRVEWGQVFDMAEVERRLAGDGGPRWLWAVHCETSTGILNDLEALAAVCGRRDAHLCVDAISSIATVPVDLSRVFLASCVGGKGIGSFPGLSMVLHHHEIAVEPTRLPRYLDLGFWAADDGIPFTQSSNLVHALEVALTRRRGTERFARIAAAGARLRASLVAKGFRIVAPDAVASPAVTTIALSEGVDSAKVGRAMEDRGFELSCNSRYLLRRGWIQVCLMGEWDDADLERVPDALAESVAAG